MRLASPPSLLLALVTAVSCGGEPPPPIAAPVIIVEAPPAAPPSTAAEGAADPPAPPAAPSATAQPVAPIARIDPEVMKQYRIDVCYFGGFAIRRGRDDYLAKLGKGRPGPGRVPVFVDLPTPSLPVPFERNARACTAATALRDPDFGDVDTAIATYVPVAVQVAKALAAARAYYQHAEHQTDGFARGQALHDELLAGFQQLDALHDQIGIALAARRKSQRPAPMEEGERLSRAAIDDASEVVLVAVAPKPNPKAFEAAAGKLDKSSEAVKLWAATQPDYPWGRIIVPQLDTFRKVAEMPRRSGIGRVGSDTIHQLIQDFVGLIEARQRALARVALANNRATTP